MFFFAILLYLVCCFQWIVNFIVSKGAERAAEPSENTCACL